MTEYLDSLKGQIDQYSNRKYKKMLLSIDTVSKSKKSIKPSDELVFQKNVIDYLVKMKRRAYRSSVVLEIDFYSIQDNPPAIHTLAKCYLDLLENNKQLDLNKRKKLVYCNDRQVKALFINYHLENHHKNKINIKVDSFSNFLKDLKVYNRILNNDFKERDLSQFLKSLHNDEELIYIENNALEKYCDFMETGNDFRNQYGEMVYQSWLSMYRKEAQKEYLSRIDFTANMLSSLFIDKASIEDNHFEKIAIALRSIILNPWFSIRLGNIPEKEGDNTSFKTFVKNKLSELVKEKNGLLFPLCTQLCITIILVQPKNSGIDLDNLARKIIPFVNDILQPPTRLISKDEIERITIPEIKEKLEKDYLDRIRIPEQSITRYQIFEVPSLKGYDEGSVLLYLGDGTNCQNIWDKMNDLLAKWYDFIR
jgi:hypothetical protein